MMFSGVRCIQVSLLHVMVMDSLMFGTSTKTLRVLSAIQTHLKINKEKMDINYKKKVKPFLHLWSRDGRRIAVGDSEGFVSIWQCDKDLYLPKQADFDKIEQLLAANLTEEYQRKQA